MECSGATLLVRWRATGSDHERPAIFPDFSKVIPREFTTESTDDKSNPMCGGHAVRLVGWGVTEGCSSCETSCEADGLCVPYWLLANSWGSTWGDQGKFRVLRSINKVSGTFDLAFQMGNVALKSSSLGNGTTLKQPENSRFGGVGGWIIRQRHRITSSRAVPVMLSAKSVEAPLAVMGVRHDGCISFFRCNRVNVLCNVAVSGGSFILKMGVDL